MQLVPLVALTRYAPGAQLDGLGTVEPGLHV